MIYSRSIQPVYAEHVQSQECTTEGERVSCDLFLCGNDTLFIIASTTTQRVYVIGLNIVLFILIFLQNEYLANEEGIPQQCHSIMHSSILQLLL